jgi:hypothetical protein
MVDVAGGSIAEDSVVWVGMVRSTVPAVGCSSDVDSSLLFGVVVFRPLLEDRFLAFPDSALGLSSSDTRDAAGVFLRRGGVLRD